LQKYNEMMSVASADFDRHRCGVVAIVFSSSFSMNLCRRLIVAQANVDRVAQERVGRPG
jgi:hypothetical protein